MDKELGNLRIHVGRDVPCHVLQSLDNPLDVSVKVPKHESYLGIRVEIGFL